MLEFFGSIASIVGLSIEVYNEIKSKYKGELGEVLGALKALSSTARTWKSIHQNYHALNKELSGVVQILSEYRNGYEQDRHISDISGIDLKNKFTNGLLGSAVYGFEKNTKSSIHTLQHFHKKAENVKDKEIEKIRDAGKVQLAESLDNIFISQDNVIKIHQDFVNFLEKIQDFRSQDHWGDTEKSFILSKKTLLNENVPAIIYDTDQVLMSLLDFYNEALDKIKVT